MRRKIWISSTVLFLTLVLGVAVTPSVAEVYSPTEEHWIVHIHNRSLSYNETEVGPSYMSAMDVVNWTITMVNSTHYNLTGIHNAIVTWPTEPGTVSIAVANNTFYVTSDTVYANLMITPKTKFNISFTATEHLVVNSTGYVQEAYNDWDMGAMHAYAVLAFYNFSIPYTDEFGEVLIFEFSYKDAWSPLRLTDTSDLSIGDNITLYTDQFRPFQPVVINATVLDEVTRSVAGQSSVDVWKLNHSGYLELWATLYDLFPDVDRLDYNETMFEYFTKDTGISVKSDFLFEELRVEGPIIYEKVLYETMNVTATNIDLTTGETTVVEFSTNLIFVAAIGIAILTGAIIARYKKKL